MPRDLALDPALWIALAPIQDDILCPHLATKLLEEMLRIERETGETDRRLLRARTCETCELTLELIEARSSK